MHDVEKYIRDLIAQGEHDRLDFKFEITSARKIAKTLVAFANTEGGRLLIGVKDNGAITGVRSEEEFYMIDSAASMYCRPEIPFESYHRTVEGRTILEIVVHPSADKPCYALDESGRWLAYHRVHDENLLANAILLKVWKRKNSPKGTFLKYTENETLLLQQLKKEGKCTFSQLKKMTGLKSAHLKTILVNLISLAVVSMHFGDGEAQYAATETDHE